MRLHVAHVWLGEATGEACWNSQQSARTEVRAIFPMSCRYAENLVCSSLRSSLCIYSSLSTISRKIDPLNAHPDPREQAHTWVGCPDGNTPSILSASPPTWLTIALRKFLEPYPNDIASQVVDLVIYLHAQQSFSHELQLSMPNEPSGSNDVVDPSMRNNQAE